MLIIVRTDTCYAVDAWDQPTKAILGLLFGTASILENELYGMLFSTNRIVKPGVSAYDIFK